MSNLRYFSAELVASKLHNEPHLLTNQKRPCEHACLIPWQKVPALLFLGLPKRSWLFECCLYSKKKEYPHYSLPPASSSLFKSFFFFKWIPKCEVVWTFIACWCIQKCFMPIYCFFIFKSRSRVSRHDTFVKRLFMAKCLEDKWCNSIYWFWLRKSHLPEYANPTFSQSVSRGHIAPCSIANGSFEPIGQVIHLRCTGFHSQARVDYQCLYDRWRHLRWQYLFEKINKKK